MSEVKTVTPVTLAEVWAAKARELAAEEAKPLPLPSGATVMARRPGPALFASYCKLPTGLAAIAAGGDGGDGNAVEAARFMFDLLTACVIEPRIARDAYGPEQSTRRISRTWM